MLGASGEHTLEIMLIPSKLYRFFDTRMHATLFTAGRIRLGNIEVYKTTHHTRRDETEGIAEFFWGDSACNTSPREGSLTRIKSVTFQANPVYLLSTCGCDVNIREMSIRFGKYMVEITRPEALLNMLNLAWNGFPTSLPNSVTLTKVLYYKGDTIAANEYLLPDPDISIFLKHRKYVDEKEYRYTFKCHIDSNIVHGNYIWLNILNPRYVLNPKVYEVRR